MTLLFNMLPFRFCSSCTHVSQDGQLRGGETHVALRIRHANRQQELWLLHIQHVLIRVSSALHVLLCASDFTYKMQDQRENHR